MPGQDIWVVGELRGGAPSPWTLQLVSGARGLAGEDGGGRVSVLIGDAAAPEALAEHGADRVTLIEGVGERAEVERVVAAARAALAGESPRLVLVPDTIAGRDAASQLAAALGAPLLAAAERLSLEEDGSLRVTHGCFGGQISAVVSVAESPCVATVSEHVFRARAREGAPPPQVDTVTAEPDARVSVLESRPPDPDSLDLAEAEVLVSGGLGVGGAEGFDLLARLAALMGGTTAATRAAVDRGWVDRARQVGQTGRTVAPKLYMACGISGALQHMVGIRDAGTLVALNIDEHAPIMQEADLAAVGDVSEVLPRLLETLGAAGGAS